MADANQSIDATDAAAAPDSEHEVEREHTRGERLFAAGAIGATFLAIWALALTMLSTGSVDQVITQVSGDATNIEGQSSASLSVGIIGLVLVETAVLVVLFRYAFTRVIVAVFALGAWGAMLWTVLLLFGTGSAAQLAGNVLGASAALALWKVPRWYVLNAIALVWGAMGIAAAGMIATPLPVVALLVLALGWDAVAVYLSGHMDELAGGAIDYKLPAMVFYPLSLPFSIDEFLAGDEGHRAMALGLGDLVLPSLLVASAAVYSPAAPVSLGAITLTAPAIGAAVGILVGVAALVCLPGRSNAGLPPLNTGAIAGYAVACVAVGVPLFPA